MSFYFLWKLAESISGHEKAVKKYEFLDHRKAKGSTTSWFALFLVPSIIVILAGACHTTYITVGGHYEATIPPAVLVLFLIAISVWLFVLWKMAEIVSGHEKVYIKKYEALEHKERKDSTLKWFVIGIIPIAALYLYWKVAETISGHEKIYVK